MKTEKQSPVEVVANDRDELNALINGYDSLLKERNLKKQVVHDLFSSLEKIDQEIIIAQGKVDKPVYPKMRTIEDVDEFMREFGAPNKRLELLLEARNQIGKQIEVEKTNDDHYAMILNETKKDIWYKLATILIKPIHIKLSQVIYAVGMSGFDLTAFIIAENANHDLSGIREQLTSEYGITL